jgi:hypothetical protein
MESMKKIAAKTKSTFSATLRSVYHFIDRRPLQSFFAVLGLLLALIILGNIIRDPAPTVNEAVRSPKEVRGTASVGSAHHGSGKNRKDRGRQDHGHHGRRRAEDIQEEGDAVSRGAWIVCSLPITRVVPPQR